MRRIAIAVSALLVSGTAALAQTTTPTRTPADPPRATTAQRPAAPNPLMQEDVSRIEGASVYGNDNSKLGSVSTVLMNPGSKTIDRLVVAAGGVLGVGAHRVAIPLTQFSWDSDKGGFKLTMTEAALKSQPEWVEGAAATGSSTPPATTTPPPMAPSSTVPPSGAGRSGNGGTESPSR